MKQPPKALKRNGCGPSTAVDGVILIDARGRIRMFNSAYERPSSIALTKSGIDAGQRYCLALREVKAHVDSIIVPFLGIPVTESFLLPPKENGGG